VIRAEIVRSLNFSILLDRRTKK